MKAKKLHRNQDYTGIKPVKNILAKLHNLNITYEILKKRFPWFIDLHIIDYIELTSKNIIIFAKAIIDRNTIDLENIDQSLHQYIIIYCNKTDTNTNIYGRWEFEWDFYHNVKEMYPEFQHYLSENSIGAGFTVGGRYASRGMGFGGSSNLGGPNTMYTYSIVPLNHSLEPRPNIMKNLSRVHIGEEIRGKQINKKGDRIFTGTILFIKKTPQSDAVSYYVILDNLTKKLIKIDPHTVTVINPKEQSNTHELVSDQIGMDMIKKESIQPIRAKKVNE